MTKVHTSISIVINRLDLVIKPTKELMVKVKGLPPRGRDNNSVHFFIAGSWDEPDGMEPQGQVVGSH